MPVPELTASHKTLIYENGGIERSDGLHRGHHFVKVGIKPPEKLSDLQKDLLLRFAGLEMEQQSLGYGTVNGMETAESHKYSAGVIDPDKTKRYFHSWQEQEEKKKEEREAKKKTVLKTILTDLWKLKRNIQKMRTMPS